jgi:hypothetical protein
MIVYRNGNEQLRALHYAEMEVGSLSLPGDPVLLHTETKILKLANNEEA